MERFEDFGLKLVIRVVLKVSSCPNDDNSAQIFICTFLYSI